MIIIYSCHYTIHCYFTSIIQNIFFYVTQSAYFLKFIFWKCYIKQINTSGLFNSGQFSHAYSFSCVVISLLHVLTQFQDVFKKRTRMLAKTHFLLGKSNPFLAEKYGCLDPSQGWNNVHCCSLVQARCKGKKVNVTGNRTTCTDFWWHCNYWLVNGPFKMIRCVRYLYLSQA